LKSAWKVVGEVWGRIIGMEVSSRVGSVKMGESVERREWWTVKGVLVGPTWKVIAWPVLGC
jgi:hypothetical protein